MLANNKEENWTPSSVPIDEFVSTYFLTAEKDKKSFQYQAEIEKSNSIKEKIDAEKAKYLPKVGVFSQANIYGGERVANAAYAFGAYLKFNFSPSEYGSEEEVELLSKAKIEEANALDLFNSLSKKVSEENIQSAKNKINFIENDEKITDEQIQVLFKLFENGNISIAQISELINKKIDLIVHKYSLKEFLLNMQLQQVSLTNKSVDPKDIWSLK